MKVGDVFQVIGAMSGRDVRWTVEQVGRRDVQVSGVWYRKAQITRWLAQGSLVHTKRESAQEHT